MRREKMYMCLCLLAFVVIAGVSSAVQTYVINYTTNTITIDGVKNSAEWEGASPEATGFRLLRTTPPGDTATENIRWQALFDDENIYIVVQTDYASLTGPAGADFADDTVPSGDTLELFINPNRNGEPNVPPPPGTPSGSGRTEDEYHIIISLAPGTYHRVSGNPGPPGLFTFAGYDTLFADNVIGTWAPTALEFGVVSISGSGATAEFKIPFSDLNGQTATLTHLVATDGVSNGEKWQWNVARIASDGSLPIWQYHAGTAHPDTGEGAFFAEREYGEVIFQGKPVSTYVKRWEQYQ
ncbi:hypothetical protein J7M23_06530 [Candidatus Sumerlaeota bacterium]|nr:hypothetical protein [Candidatus Sumerlaeota bacterium]